ncbi:MAG: hypothetical protein ACOH10_04010 [Rhodoglobus sp.]
MTTAAHTTTFSHSGATIGRRALAGIVGGVAGGIAFGILMAMMGMLPMIAAMVGSTSAVVGFIVHIGMSIMIGLGLTVLFGNLLLTSYPRGIVVGLGYGAVWWVLGPLMVMPMMFGMPLFTIDTPALFSLMGHLIYGAILGAVAVKILKNSR